MSMQMTKVEQQTDYTLLRGGRWGSGSCLPRRQSFWSCGIQGSTGIRWQGALGDNMGHVFKHILSIFMEALVLKGC